MSQKLRAAYAAIRELHWEKGVHQEDKTEFVLQQSGERTTVTVTGHKHLEIGTYLQRAHCEMSRLLSIEERVEVLVMAIAATGLGDGNSDLMTEHLLSLKEVFEQDECESLA